MKSRALFLILGSLLVAGSAFGQTFTATLTGAQEVPPADPDGSGTATVSISGTTVTYTIVANLIDAPTAQHIHSGAAGVNGPVVVNLPGTWVGSGQGPWTLNGSTTTDAATAGAIIANPAAFYVNVHNGPFPGGAIRGQLAAAAAAAAVPTTSVWGLALLGMAIAFGALLVLRRA